MRTEGELIDSGKTSVESIAIDGDEPIAIASTPTQSADSKILFMYERVCTLKTTITLPGRPTDYREAGQRLVFQTLAPRSTTLGRIPLGIIHFKFDLGVKPAKCFTVVI